MKDQVSMSSELTLKKYRKRGGQAALVELLEVAQGVAFRVAFRVLGQREDAQDAAQEVLLELLEQLDGLQDDDHLQGWLYRASMNEAIDHWRRKQRRMKREQKYSESQPDEVEPNELEDSEQKIALHKCIAELSDSAQSLIVGYYFEGQALKQLAKRRNCSTTAIWKQLENHRNQLARKLKRVGCVGIAANLSDSLAAMPVPPAVPALPAKVLAKAAAMPAGISSSLIVGGVVMTANKSILITAIIAVGCFAIGNITVPLFNSGESIVNDSTDSLKVAGTSTTASAALKKQIAKLKAQLKESNDNAKLAVASPKAAPQEDLAESK